MREALLGLLLALCTIASYVRIDNDYIALIHACAREHACMAMYLAGLAECTVKFFLVHMSMMPGEKCHRKI